MSTTPKILVIDDEQKVLDLIGFRLHLLGYRMIAATNGEDGLALAESEQPDLIILDITMPGLDGLTVCGRLKKSDATANIPILMLTARCDVEDVNKAMTVGADDYIVKPYDPTVLQTKIRLALSGGAAASSDIRSHS